MTELTDVVLAVALIPVDEPIFVLRASDPASAELVTRWAEMTLASSGNADLARLGFDQAQAMRHWARKTAATRAAAITGAAGRAVLDGQEPHQTSIPGLGASEAGK
jgi:hypothetical protein